MSAVLLLVSDNKETRRIAPAEAIRSSIASDSGSRRWRPTAAAIPVSVLPWKNFATSVGLRGSVHPLLEQGSIDATGARFPTALSEMIGLEQMEQIMFDGQHRYRHDQPAHDGVYALLAVYFMAGWEVER
jgi:hypothetical protein